MNREIKLKQPGFLVVELLLAVTASLFGFGLYASKTGVATQDLARLKNLESLNYAMADHYVRYLEEPVLSSTSGSQNIEKAASVNVGSGNKITNVTATSGFTFTKLNGNKCNRNSVDKEVVFYQGPVGLVYCRADGNVEVLKFR
jgi:hypothetical protein